MDNILILTDGLKGYFEDLELAELCKSFEVRLRSTNGGPNHMRLARDLLSRPEHGNNGRLLRALVSSLLSRARERVAHTSFESQEHHSEMVNRLEALKATLGNPTLPTEIIIPEDHPFTAKSEIRDFFSQADSVITIVDKYVGVGTLDCIRDVGQPIRLLTGTSNRSIEARFDDALRDLRAEGITIEVRRHKNLHDRYVLFSDRVWLVGSSLKDAGKKSFNVIEFVDGKASIQADIKAKWNEASKYDP